MPTRAVLDLVDDASPRTFRWRWGWAIPHGAFPSRLGPYAAAPPQVASSPDAVTSAGQSRNVDTATGSATTSIRTGMRVLASAGEMHFPSRIGTMSPPESWLAFQAARSHALS